MQWILATIAFYLALRNRDNEPVKFYWLVVMVYWLINYHHSRRKS